MFVIGAAHLPYYEKGSDESERDFSQLQFSQAVSFQFVFRLWPGDDYDWDILVFGRIHRLSQPTWFHHASLLDNDTAHRTLFGYID